VVRRRGEGLRRRGEKTLWWRRMVEGLL